MTSTHREAAPHDLYLWRGDYVEVPFRFGNSTNDDPPVFEPWNLTGVEVKAQIRAKQDSSDVLAEFAAVVADQADPATEGMVTLSLETGDTDGLPSRAKWDLQLTWPGNRPRTLLAGNVYTSKDTTRE